MSQHDVFVPSTASADFEVWKTRIGKAKVKLLCDGKVLDSYVDTALSKANYLCVRYTGATPGPPNTSKRYQTRSVTKPEPTVLAFIIAQRRDAPEGGGCDFYIDVVCAAKGNGAGFLRAVLQHARELKCRTASLSALAHVETYYAQFGFLAGDADPCAPGATARRVAAAGGSKKYGVRLRKCLLHGANTNTVAKDRQAAYFPTKSLSIRTERTDDRFRPQRRVPQKTQSLGGGRSPSPALARTASLGLPARTPWRSPRRSPSVARAASSGSGIDVGFSDAERELLRRVLRRSPSPESRRAITPPRNSAPLSFHSQSILPSIRSSGELGIPSSFRSGGHASSRGNNDRRRTPLHPVPRGLTVSPPQSPPRGPRPSLAAAGDSPLARRQPSSTPSYNSNDDEAESRYRPQGWSPARFFPPDSPRGPPRAPPPRRPPPPRPAPPPNVRGAKEKAENERIQAFMSALRNRGELETPPESSGSAIPRGPRRRLAR